MTEKGQLTASFEVASRVPRNIVSLNRRILDSRFVMYRIEFKKGNDRMGSGGSMNWTMVIVVARADVFDDCLTSIIIRPCSKNRLASALRRKIKVDRSTA